MNVRENEWRQEKRYKQCKFDAWNSVDLIMEVREKQRDIAYDWVNSM